MRVDSETGLVLHNGWIVRSPMAVRALQVLSAVFGVLYAFLGLRFVLTYLGANQGAGFSRFVFGVSEAFYLPFRALVPNGSDGAGHPIAWSILLAIVAYALLHAGLRSLVRMASRPR